jgi:hypothetical protein
MVCTSCGIIEAFARPNWQERPAQGSLSGVKAPPAFLRDVVRIWEQHGEATLTLLLSRAVALSI